MNPTEEEVLGYAETLRNWDRWGPDDELGTLNFITPEKRVAAAREVRSGRTVSLAHDLNTHSQPNNPQPAAHMMLMTGGGGAATTSASHAMALRQHTSTRSATSTGKGRCGMAARFRT